MEAIRCFTYNRPNDWEKYLQQLAGALRFSVNRHTGFTPNMLMLGREINQPVDLMFRTPTEHKKDLDEYTSQLGKNILSAHEVARDKLRTSQARMKRDYNVRVENMYHVGDLVYISDMTYKQGTSKKLVAPWKEPYVIINKTTPYLYKVKNNHKETAMNHNRLKICQDRVIPKWVSRYRLREQSNNTSTLKPCWGTY